MDEEQQQVAEILEEPILAQEIQSEPEPEEKPKRSRRSKKTEEPAPEPVPEPAPRPTATGLVLYGAAKLKAKFLKR